MNQKTIKKLKKIINYEKEDETQKRLLNRLKKQYNDLSEKAKPIFLDKLTKMYNN
tara:strand:- start:218 stop:382 length:165 start_codon:yes stop_codon:yes gene_type:complete